MEKTLYICDRCGFQSIEDFSYWQVVYHKNIQKRDKTFLCPSCAGKFEFFLATVK